MKIFSIIGAALLGLAISGKAQAQVPTGPGSGTVVPGQPNSPVGASTTGTVTTGVGIPLGTSTGTTATPGGLPGGAGTTVGTPLGTGTSVSDNGAVRSTQPNGVTTPGTSTRRAAPRTTTRP